MIVTKNRTRKRAEWKLYEFSRLLLIQMEKKYGMDIFD